MNDLFCRYIHRSYRVHLFTGSPKMSEEKSTFQIVNWSSYIATTEFFSADPKLYRSVDDRKLSGNTFEMSSSIIIFDVILFNEANFLTAKHLKLTSGKFIKNNTKHMTLI